MLTVRLNEETEVRLADILAHEKTDKSELIRRLIDERWLALQLGKQTVLERLGGPPQHLFDGPPNLSERKTRKRTIAKRILEQLTEWTITLWFW